MRWGVLAIVVALALMVSAASSIPAHSIDWPVVKVVSATELAKSRSSHYIYIDNECGGVLVTSWGGLEAIENLAPDRDMKSVIDTGIPMRSAKKMDLSLNEYFMKIADSDTANYVFAAMGSGYDGVMIVIMKPGAPDWAIERAKTYAIDTARVYGMGGVYIVKMDIANSVLPKNLANPYQAGDIVTEFFAKNDVKMKLVETTPLKQLGYIQVMAKVSKEHLTDDLYRSLAEHMSNSGICSPVWIILGSHDGPVTYDIPLSNNQQPDNAPSPQAGERSSIPVNLLLIGIGAAIAVVALFIRPF